MVMLCCHLLECQYLESLTVLVQSGGSFCVLSPVVHGDIALGINTTTKYNTIHRKRVCVNGTQETLFIGS